MVALFNRGDRHHARAFAYFEACRDDLVTNIAVITEAVHMLDFSHAAATDFLGWVNEAFTIDQATASDLTRIGRIMKMYDDLPADFADASLVAMCERLKLGRIATFDRDFDVYRLADGPSLTNVLARG